MSERNPLASAGPDKIYQKLVELGCEWSEAHAAASMLEETQKPLLARLTLGRMESRGTRTQAETEALASVEYAEHIARMVEAKRAANTARVRYQSAQVWAELLRTQAATRRAEMQLGHLAT